MNTHRAGIALLAACASIVAPLQAQVPSASADTDIEEVRVDASRSQALASVATAAHNLEDGTFNLFNAWRSADVINQSAAAYLSQTSLGDHLLALRSPVLTGSGACGSYRIEEDGLAIRPPGFCNINGLSELSLALAERVQLVVGPQGGALGANGNLGAIRVFSPDTDSLQPSLNLALSANSASSLRALADWRTDNQFLGVALDSIEGHRAASGADVQHLRWVYSPRSKAGKGESALTLTHRLSLVNRNQETAGYAQGFEAYKNRRLAEGNRNPEAYRDLYALRYDVRMQFALGDYELAIRPYIRRSSMQFLMHFLLGTPVEKNSHTSTGVRFDISTTRDNLVFAAGAWLEYLNASLLQHQAEVYTGTSRFNNRYNRPQGVHYDFDVAGSEIGLRAGVDLDLSERLSLVVDGSFARFDYDYNNKGPHGPVLAEDAPQNTIVQYSRPPSQVNGYDGFSLRSVLVYEASQAWRLVAGFGRAFRPPQIQELYRLRRDSDVPEIDAETSSETSFKALYSAGSHQLDFEVFTGKRSDVIYRDSNAAMHSDGAYDFEGYGITWRLSQPRYQILLSAYSEDHTYANTTQSARIGGQVDGAPDWRASASFAWYPRAGHSFGLRLEGVGGYPLEATGEHWYGGHAVATIAGEHSLPGDYRLGWRIGNAANKAGATRADYAFGNYRYFPLEPRTLTITLRKRFD